MFAITVHPRVRIVEVKFAGLLSLPELAEARAQVAATLVMYHFAPGTFTKLLDFTETPIQPQAVHEELVRMGMDPELMPARLAIWIGNSPARMQARRAQLGCPSAIFRDRADALAWLNGSDVSGAEHAEAA